MHAPDILSLSFDKVLTTVAEFMPLTDILKILLKAPVLRSA